jgi:hypothetical protein
MYRCDFESRGGTHNVAIEAAAELEAQSEASFICIILVLAVSSCDPLDLSG